MTPPVGPGRPGPRRLLGGGLAVLVVLALAVPLVSGLARGEGGAETAPLLHRAAPPLAGPTLDGGHVDLADLRGSVVLVNVWASWCAPCREEMPLLAEAARAWGPAGLRVVGIDVNDRPESAAAFLDEIGGVPFPSVADPDGRLAVAWGTIGVPETYVVDRDGVVVAKAVGALQPDWLAEHVHPLLEQQ